MTSLAAPHLYVHVPFCARRCAYCDFSIAVRREVPVGEYVAAIARELDLRSLGGASLATLYFGGGTPSKLGATGVPALLDVVRGRYAIDVDAEVTLETNPEDVTPDAVRAWRAAGINRISLGAQSFDEGVLSWMHRTHGAGDIERAVGVARDAGFDNISLDLIFALPESVGRDWHADLDRALQLEPEHLSLYGLTVEPHTPLARWTAQGSVHETPDARWEHEFLEAHARLSAAGFAHYEVSNYAREGRRARHNDAYWTDRAYAGAGPAAHGYDGATRRWNESAYAHWLARVQAGEDPGAGCERLSAEERRAERIYLGLRTDRGIQLEPGAAAVVQSWVDAGWGEVIQRHDSRSFVLTAPGWLRLDAIATSLTSFGSR